MWEVEPKGPPYRILRSGIPLEIEIRPAPPISIVIFAILFTPLWVAGSVIVLLGMMQQDGPRWFLALWLTIWLFAGGYNTNSPIMWDNGSVARIGRGTAGKRKKLEGAAKPPPQVFLYQRPDARKDLCRFAKVPP